MSSLSELWAKISPNSAKIENLLPEQQANLLRSLKDLDLAQLKRIRSCQGRKPLVETFEIVDDVLKPTIKIIDRGQRELAAGRVGVVILAGGLGSRLGKKIPKGMVPLTPIRKKTLFQIFAEKIITGQKQYKHCFPLAIMTSRHVQSEVKNFFFDHCFWGLNPAKVHFFFQNELPLLDIAGDPLLAANGSIFTAPNGNGSVFNALFYSGIAKKFKDAGASHLVVIPIDNPLADPLSSALIGAVATKSDKSQRERGLICFKAVERLHQTEKTGVFVLKAGSLKVVEYSDFQIMCQNRNLFAGKDTFGLANTGEFCIDLKFLMQLGEMPLSQWPIHVAKKILNLDNKTEVQKAEYFNFDLLNWTENAQIIRFCRKSTFLPLKNAQGLNSPADIRYKMLKIDEEIYR